MKRPKVVIGVDAGNENIQIVMFNGKLIIKNKVDRNKQIDISISKNNDTFNVRYKNKLYVVGNYAEQPSSRMEGKYTENHLIAVLVAISQLVTNGSELYIAIGESANVYFNQDHKKNLIDLFTGLHNITVNNEEYEYLIKEVYVLPEGIGHKITNYQNYINNKVSYTIDIGSSTLNYIYAQGLVPIESRCASFPMGMHNLVSNIRKSLSRNGGPPNMTDQQIKEYIEFGCKNEKINNTIKSEIINQFNKLDSYLEADGIRIKDLQEVEFCGGGSMTLKSYIEKRYDNSIVIDDPLWSNVKGFYKFANQKYNR